MPLRIASICVVVPVLWFAGCGGTTTVTTTVPNTTAANSPTPPSASVYHPPPPPRSVTFRVALSGTAGASTEFPAPAGAPNGSGLAVISVNAPALELCWAFSQLKNVTGPTVARIYRLAARAAWMYGLKLGGTYKASGCRHVNPIFLGLLGAYPQEFWISIHTTRFANGAVRGQI